MNKYINIEKTQNKSNVSFYKKISSLLLILTYLLLFFCYYQYIYPEYGYSGFSIKSYNSNIFIISIFIVMIIVGLIQEINNSFYYSVALYIVWFYVLPELILQVCMGIDLIRFLIVFLPILSIYCIDKIKFNKIKCPDFFSLNNKNGKYFIIIICIMIIPFLFYIYRVDISTLFFKDVYQARTEAVANSNLYLAYVTGPLMRIILPILLIFSLYNKNYKSFCLFLIAFLYIYMVTGASRSYLLILFFILFLYGKGTIEKKWNRVLVLFLLLLTVNSILNNEFLTSMIRRTWFVGQLWEYKYVNYFRVSGFTFFSQLKIVKFLGVFAKYREYGNLGQWFGVVVSKVKTNATINSFIEGYISLGIVGLLIINFVFSFLLVFINSLNIREEYNTILVFSCCLLISLPIDTCISAGLIVFIFVSIFIIPKKINLRKEGKNE